MNFIAIFFYLFSCLWASQDDPTAISDDPIEVAVQTFKARCEERISFYQTKLTSPEDPLLAGLNPTDKQAQQLFNGMQKLGNSPEQTRITMCNFAKGHVERYQNIMDVCENYTHCHDIRRIDLIFYLIHHFQEKFHDEKDHHHTLWCNAWEIFGVHEEKNFTTISEEFKEILGDSVTTKSNRMCSIIKRNLLETCLGASNTSLGTRTYTLDINRYLSNVRNKFYDAKELDFDMKESDRNLFCSMKNSLNVLYIKMKTILFQLEGNIISGQNVIKILDDLAFLKQRNVKATLVILIHEIEAELDRLVSPWREKAQEIEQAREMERLRQLLMPKKPAPKPTKPKKSSQTEAPQPTEETSEEDILVEGLFQNATVSESQCKELASQVNQPIEQALHMVGITTRLAIPTEVIEAFAFEKTKLYSVMLSIKAGERIKQRDFLKAIEQFVRKRSEDPSSAVQGQGGSKMKYTVDAPQNPTDKLDLHQEHFDNIIVPANPRYKKVLTWLQSLGYFLEDKTEALTS